MKFTLTFTPDQINPAYQKALQTAAQKTSLKGFRPGKAPLNLVEESLDKAKLYESALNQLLPQAYADHIKTNQLKPIIQPKITLKSMEPNQNWEVEVEIAQKPKVTLNDYQKAVIKNVKPPKKANTSKRSNKDDKSDNEVVDQIIDVLLTTCEVKIPELLIEDSVQYSLSKLVDQVSKLGLTVDQYLKSLKKTPDDIRAQYVKQANKDLSIEFILEAIADEQKLHPKQAQIDEITNSIKDPETKKFAQNDLNTLISIRTSLMRSRVIDYLKSLVTKVEKAKK